METKLHISLDALKALMLIIVVAVVKKQEPHLMQDLVRQGFFLCCVFMKDQTLKLRSSRYTSKGNSKKNFKGQLKIQFYRCHYSWSCFLQFHWCLWSWCPRLCWCFWLFFSLALLVLAKFELIFFPCVVCKLVVMVGLQCTMAVFSPHDMSLVFSFVFDDVHGRAFLGFYQCVWLLLSWASLVFTIIVLFNYVGVHDYVILNSIGVHGHVFLGFVGVPIHYSNIVLLVFLVIAFLGS